jgi:hypothetical protein
MLVVGTLTYEYLKSIQFRLKRYNLHFIIIGSLIVFNFYIYIYIYIYICIYMTAAVRKTWN